MEKEGRGRDRETERERERAVDYELLIVKAAGIFARLPRDLPSYFRPFFTLPLSLSSSLWFSLFPSIYVFGVFI